MNFLFKKQGEYCMKNFDVLINELQSNVSVISDFLANPKKVIEEYNLTDEQKKAMLSRDIASLDNLGIEKSVAVGALSGAHRGELTYT
jgi:cephalosporin hydroxylase